MKKVLKFFSLILSIVLVVSASISCVRNIDNVNDVDDNSSTNNSTQQQEQQVDFSALNMVSIGDSILSGAGIDNPVTFKLKELLGLKNCLNYGIPGSALSAINGYNPYVYRYDKMLDNADIVFVQCSGNDIDRIEVGNYTDTTLDTFCGCVNYLIKGLKEKYPSAWIFFQPGFMRAEVYVEKATSYMSAMKEVCKLNNVDYFDTFVRDYPYDYKTDTVDWVHLNQNFTNTVWAPDLAQFIKDNYKK